VNPIPCNGDSGYLSNNDVIKGMASEIEMLREQLRVSNEMQFKYMDDCVRALAENTRLRNCLHKEVQALHGPYASWHDPKDGNQP
jgi:hypothetical protein